ncbi:MAG: hypothetical protein IPM95_09835 [Sphingobacteriales bacterium]|nr:hypothetical protein [Sphingobacteriales bacterium]
MHRFYTLLFLILFSQAQAKINDVALSKEQFDSLLQFKIKNTDTGSIKIEAFIKFYKQNPQLNTIDSSDIISIAKLLIQNNSLTYKNDSHQLICNKLSEDIINSDFNKRCLLLAKEQQAEISDYFKQNLKKYLQNEIFNFYYNNNVLSFLDKQSYVEVLKPAALIDLLEKQKAERFLNELTFVIKNSKHNLFNQ